MAQPKRKDWLPGALIVGGVVVVGVLGVYAAMTKNIPVDQRALAPVAVRTPIAPGAQVVQVPHTGMQKGELVISTEPKEVPQGEDPMLTAINGFIMATPAIPKGAMARSVVVNGGVATVDFNKQFLTSYGTDDESTVVNGVLAALGQFKGVEKATFTVEGQVLDTLGHSDLTVPVGVVHATATTSAPTK